MIPILTLMKTQSRMMKMMCDLMKVMMLTMTMGSLSEALRARGDHWGTAIEVKRNGGS
jgi:hypothetical protein